MNPLSFPWYSVDMNAFIFFIVIVAVIGGAFWYANKDDLSQPKAAYCAHIQALQSQEDYELSYGERAKAVLKGCL